jgi:hypothetical protein
MHTKCKHIEYQRCKTNHMSNFSNAIKIVALRVLLTTWLQVWVDAMAD